MYHILTIFTIFTYIDHLHYVLLFVILIMNLLKPPLQFEWDESKNIINIQKHRISFDTASLVFADDNRIEYHDVVHSVYEDRYVVIGMVENTLFVVYTMRGDVTRIISARLATKTERGLYNDCY